MPGGTTETDPRRVSAGRRQGVLPVQGRAEPTFHDGCQAVPRPILNDNHPARPKQLYHRFPPSDRVLGSFDLPEAELTTPVLSLGTVGLLNQDVATDCRDDLLMVGRLKCWRFSKSSPATGQLVRTDRLRNIGFTKQAAQKRSCSLNLTDDAGRKSVVVRLAIGRCAPPDRMNLPEPFNECAADVR